MEKQEKRLRRKRKIRARISKTSGRPRVSIFRSSKFIYAQIIDDVKGETLVSFSSKDLAKKDIEKKNKVEIAKLVGEGLAKKAKKAKISEVIFDRAGYKYHGKVKALAEGAREGGLKF